MWWSEVQIEQFRWCCLATADASFRFASFDHMTEGHAGVARHVILVIPIDLDCQLFVGFHAVANLFNGEEDVQALLPEAELALDFPFVTGDLWRKGS